MFLQKVTLQIDLKKFSLFKAFRKLFLGDMLLVVLKGKKLLLNLFIVSELDS